MFVWPSWVLFCTITVDPDSIHGNKVKRRQSNIQVFFKEDDLYYDSKIQEPVSVTWWYQDKQISTIKLNK